jgi:hypothetical protein
MPAGENAEAATAGTPPAPAGIPSTPAVLEPSDAEVAAWAETERARREAWLQGPTADERAAWTQRERERRLAGLTAEQAAQPADLGRRGAYLVREMQLAAEGAVSLVWKELTTEGALGAVQKWSGRGLEVLVRAGREWEEEFAQPSRRRPVPSEDAVP